MLRTVDNSSEASEGQILQNLIELDVHTRLNFSGKCKKTALP